jgi:hypothetical protein
MTNKEAIQAIRCNYPSAHSAQYTTLREALDMAIASLAAKSCEGCKRLREERQNGFKAGYEDAVRDYEENS